MLLAVLLEAFMDRYYPMELQPVRPPADFATRATRFTGSYQANRRSYTTWEKVFSLFSEPISIRAADDGTLSVKAPEGAQRFVETEPLVFREVDGDTVLIFREDAQGNIKYAYGDSAGAFEKQAWYEVPLIHYVLLTICMLLFLSVIIVAPVGFFVNRRRTDRQPQPRLARAARWVLGGAAVLSLAFVVFFVVATDGNTVVTGEAPLLNVLGFISIPLAVLAIGAVVFSVLAWKNQYWHIAGRVHYTLATLAAVAFVWFLNYWNLLGVI